MENQQPHAIQIISLNNNEIKLNLDSLRQILLQEDIKDKRVCVVSVTGVFRQGKSFLLNLLLRYLRLKYKDKKDVTSNWLDSSDGPIVGFPWRGGSKRHTTGILIWSEIFLAELPSGEEVAVILLDTQGTFDNVTSITHCAAIFALSTLISSVQIYNLKENIKQYDLSHLECFSGYGQLLGNDDSPFQNLMFLIRDWPCPDEKPFGEEGGQQLLNEIFDNQEEQPEEVIKQVKNIKELFKKITCYLLPYPGIEVATSSVTFQGKVEVLDDKFRKQIDKFAPSILDPEHIVLKEVNGENVKVKDLFYFIESYCNSFHTTEMPSLQTMFKASSDAHHIIVVRESEVIYKNIMNFIKAKDTKALDKNTLEVKHSEGVSKAMEHFNKKKIIGNKEMKHQNKLKLEQILKEKFSEYENLNEIKYQKEQELAKEIQLREEQKLREEQQRMYEAKLQQEQEMKRQEELKAVEARKARILEMQKRRQSEEELKKERERRHEEQLRNERLQREQQMKHEENLRREQQMRHEQEMQHQAKLRQEEQLRHEQQLAFEQKLRREERSYLQYSCSPGPSFSPAPLPTYVPLQRQDPFHMGDLQRETKKLYKDIACQEFNLQPRRGRPPASATCSPSLMDHILQMGPLDAATKRQYKAAVCQEYNLQPRRGRPPGSRNRK